MPPQEELRPAAGARERPSAPFGLRSGRAASGARAGAPAARGGPRVPHTRGGPSVQGRRRGPRALGVASAPDGLRRMSGAAAKAVRRQPRLPAARAPASCASAARKGGSCGPCIRPAGRLRPAARDRFGLALSPEGRGAAGRPGDPRASAGRPPARDPRTGQQASWSRRESCRDPASPGPSRSASSSPPRRGGICLGSPTASRSAAPLHLSSGPAGRPRVPGPRPRTGCRPRPRPAPPRGWLPLPRDSPRAAAFP